MDVIDSNSYPIFAKLVSAVIGAGNNGFVKRYLSLILMSDFYPV